MTIPSGSGTEVLKRAFIHDNNGGYGELLSGQTNHIYTILSITAADQTGSSQNISIRVNTGSNDIFILPTTVLPGN